MFSSTSKYLFVSWLQNPTYYFIYLLVVYSPSTRLRDIFVLLGFSNATNSKISFSVDAKCYYLLRITLSTCAFWVVVGNSNKWSYYKTSFACLYIAHLRTRVFIRVTRTCLRDIFVLLGFSNATNSKISFSVDTKC